MRIVLLLLLLVSAAGCGQKGALIAPAEPDWAEVMMLLM